MSCCLPITYNSTSAFDQGGKKCGKKTFPEKLITKEFLAFQAIPPAVHTSSSCAYAVSGADPVTLKNLGKRCNYPEKSISSYNVLKEGKRIFPGSYKTSVPLRGKLTPRDREVLVQGALNPHKVCLKTSYPSINESCVQVIVKQGKKTFPNHRNLSLFFFDNVNASKLKPSIYLTKQNLRKNGIFVSSVKSAPLGKASN